MEYDVARRRWKKVNGEREKKQDIVVPRNDGILMAVKFCQQAEGIWRDIEMALQPFHYFLCHLNVSVIKYNIRKFVSNILLKTRE